MTEEHLSQPREDNEDDYVLDFLTSSAISRVTYKFLILYLPIFWLGGLLTVAALLALIMWIPGLIFLLLLPLILFGLHFAFFFACIVASRLFLVLINIIHKPKEGIFKAEKRNQDFEFWCLRTEIKKVGVWLLNNSFLPWTDVWAFKWFGIRMDTSSHLNDAWVDLEFIEMRREVIVGQAATLMSSMVVGKYLIIKKIFLDDYAVVGGLATLGPGAKMEKDTLLGAASIAIYNQVLEKEWIYFGMPSKKLKPNKLAVTKILKKDIDGEKSYEVEHEVNIDEDKKDLIDS